MHVGSLHYFICLYGMYRGIFVFEKVNLQQIRSANLQSVGFASFK